MNYYMNRGEEIRKERGHEFYENWAKRIRGGLDPVKEKEVLKLWEASKEDG